MDRMHLEQLLQSVASGELTPNKAYESLKTLPFEDLGFVNIDQHRTIRTGYPEAVFCQGKTSEQIAIIIKKLVETNDNVIGSRATKENYEVVLEVVADAVFYEEARMIVVNRNPKPKSEKTIDIITAGTADITVLEEAAVTALSLIHI